MKARLAHQAVLKKLAKQSSSKEGNSNEELINPEYFKCLKGRDVITAKVSDHHPIIHDGVLFWNIMMQGKIRNGRTGISYNNGFGIIENNEHYINRLVKVADVIAEMMYSHPSVDVISLCEGPIQPLHIDTLLHSLKKYHSMDKFFIDSAVKDIFHQPNIESFPNWGLLMLADKKYKINDVKCDVMDHSIIFNKLANRFHIWKLTNDEGKNKYLALGHFPFGGDERITDKHKLSVHGNMYCNLVKNVINYYSDKQFILCADFNLNPNLISKWEDRAMDLIRHNNSILITAEKRLSKSIIDTVTVDGILLSVREKQRYDNSRFNFGLFTRLKNEYKLFQSSIKEYLIKNHDKNSNSQRSI